MKEIYRRRGWAAEQIVYDDMSIAVSWRARPELSWPSHRATRKAGWIRLERSDACINWRVVSELEEHAFFREMNIWVSGPIIGIKNLAEMLTHPEHLRGYAETEGYAAGTSVFQNRHSIQYASWREKAGVTPSTTPNPWRRERRQIVLDRETRRG